MTVTYFLKGIPPLRRVIPGDYEIIDLGAEKLEDFLQKPLLTS